MLDQRPLSNSGCVLLNTRTHLRIYSRWWFVIKCMQVGCSLEELDISGAHIGTAAASLLSLLNCTPPSADSAVSAGQDRGSSSSSHSSATATGRPLRLRRLLLSGCVMEQSVAKALSAAAAAGQGRSGSCAVVM